MGSRNLREAIAVYLRTARGVRCDSDQIMIVCGSLHAIEISARTLLEPGSRVWVEEPGYPFARNTLALHGCQIVPVSVDGEGLVVNVGYKEEIIRGESSTLCRGAEALASVIGPKDETAKVVKEIYEKTPLTRKYFQKRENAVTCR